MSKEKQQKVIRVVAAVICDSFAEKKKIFATARGYGEFKGQWEFPGGKIESGETPQQALEREIAEELETRITVGEYIDTIEYDYPDFHLSMDCFWCEVVEGNLTLVEAEEGRWLGQEELHQVQWLPADITLIETIKTQMNKGDNLMTDVLETIKNRRSVRKYNDTPVEEATIAQIVEAGRWAPTGGNCQTVHFTVIQNADILAELREKVQTAFAQMTFSEDLYISMQNSIRLSKNGNYVYDYGAPVLVVVSNVAGYPNAIADSACAIQSMMLEATSLGVGSCWINQLHWLEEDDTVREVLNRCGIDRAETVCGAMALGNYDGTYAQRERTGMKVDWVK